MSVVIEALNLILMVVKTVDAAKIRVSPMVLAQTRPNLKLQQKEQRYQFLTHQVVQLKETLLSLAGLKAKKDKLAKKSKKYSSSVIAFADQKKAILSLSPRFLICKTKQVRKLFQRSC